MTPETLVGGLFAAVLAWVALQFAINWAVEWWRHPPEPPRGLADMGVVPPHPVEDAGPVEFEDYDG